MTAELRVNHGYLNMLDNHTADVAHRFTRVIRHNDVGSNLLSMIVDFLVQSYLQVNLSIAEGKSFADQRAWKTTSTGSGSVLQLIQRKIDISYTHSRFELESCKKVPNGLCM